MNNNLIGVFVLVVLLSGCSSPYETKDACDALFWGTPGFLEPGACADARAEVRAREVERRMLDREKIRGYREAKKETSYDTIGGHGGNEKETLYAIKSEDGTMSESFTMDELLKDNITVGLATYTIEDSNNSGNIDYDDFDISKKFKQSEPLYVVLYRAQGTEDKLKKGKISAYIVNNEGMEVRRFESSEVVYFYYYGGEHFSSELFEKGGYGEYRIHWYIDTGEGKKYVMTDKFELTP